MELSEWRGDWTFFAHNKATRPENECTGGWSDFCRSIAPIGNPMLGCDKERVRYFVPSALKLAPLIGKTRKRATKLGEALEGKQRSASHTTEASMIVLDLDGMRGEQFERCLKRLASDGKAFLAYSSYSYGNPQKKGVRARLVVPVDAPLNNQGYKVAADVLQSKYFENQADPKGFSLCQQMGVWATNPLWEKRAFRIAIKGDVFATEALLAVGQKIRPKTTKKNAFAAANELYLDKERVESALRWLDPVPYKTWVNFGLYLKAAYGDCAYSTWLNWGNTAPDEVTDKNTDEYAPDYVWDALDPLLPPDAGAGALFAAAKDSAANLVRVAAKSGEWTDAAKDAVGYLMTHHKRFFNEHFGV